MWRLLHVWRLSAALLVLGALIAAAVLSGRGVALASHNFSDVPDSVFYHDFVDFLVQNALTAGCGVGLYCGENAVTWGRVFLGPLGSRCSGMVGVASTSETARRSSICRLRRPRR